LNRGCVRDILQIRSAKPSKVEFDVKLEHKDRIFYGENSFTIVISPSRYWLIEPSKDLLAADIHYPLKIVAPAFLKKSFVARGEKLILSRYFGQWSFSVEGQSFISPLEFVSMIDISSYKLLSPSSDLLPFWEIDIFHKILPRSFSNCH